MGGTGVGQPITSVAPTTTAAALTSLTTGVSPSTHGILGYRMAVDDEIMNVLHWTAGLCPPRDLRRERPPTTHWPHRARDAHAFPPKCTTASEWDC